MSKKGENIYKRKDQRWEARYVRAYRQDGTIQYGYCYGKTYREAKQKMETAKLKLSESRTQHGPGGDEMFGVYCDEWLKLCRSRVKESTFVKYSAVLDKYIKPSLSQYPVQRITSVIIEDMSYALLYQNGLSAKTVQDILTILRSIWKYTTRRFPGMLQTVDIVCPKVSKQNIRVLSVEEQTRFIAYLSHDTDLCKAGILLSLLTGMRIGEVCALRRECISLEARTIYVSATMQRLKNTGDHTGRKTKVVISEPKSNYSDRVIPLTDYAVGICAVLAKLEDTAFVLTGSTECYMEPRTLQYRLQKYTRECGLEDVHFHTLRHTFATRCVEVNFEIKTLSEILGHSSPRITLERYVHPSLELKRENMLKLAAVGF